MRDMAFDLDHGLIKFQVKFVCGHEKFFSRNLEQPEKK